MDLKQFESYIGSNIFVLYSDNGIICRAFGVLNHVDFNSLTLETRANIMVISADQIQKIKIPKGDNYE